MKWPLNSAPSPPDRLAREETTPFSVQLWRYRTDRGWTQEELAERAGLSPRGIRALGQGERRRPYKHSVGSGTSQRSSTCSATRTSASLPSPGRGEAAKRGWSLWPTSFCEFRGALMAGGFEELEGMPLPDALRPGALWRRCAAEES